MDVPANDRHISPAQMRAARALLDWSREEMATRCNIARNTIARLEAEGRLPTQRTLSGILDVLEREGIVFLADDAGEGVYRKATSS